MVSAQKPSSVRPAAGGSTTDPRPWPKPLVYVAGPYTRPDPVINTRNACLVADELAAMGAAVIVPHLSLLWHAISPQSIETWYQRDIDVLRHCNAVVLLPVPGPSTGADAEVAEAARLGLTVYCWPEAQDAFAAYVGRWAA
jgi:hypothetical protein